MAPVWFISENPAKKDGVVEGPPPEPPAVLEFRDVLVKNNQGSSATIIMATPTLTEVGDLMFAFMAIHSAIGDLRIFPDDPTDGWALLDQQRENNAGQDHRYAVYWKVADGSDASGGASYQWNSRTSLNDGDRTDEMDGYIAAFSGVQEPATDMDFLYSWEAAAVSGNSAQILVGDIEFPADLALDGDGLLVCMLVNDSSATTITSPSEMTEHLNDAGDIWHRMVLVSETVSAASGSVGPKEFTQSSGTDHLALAFILRPLTTGGRNNAIYDYPKIADVAQRFISAQANVTNIIATPPSGTVVGDLLLLILDHDPSTVAGSGVDVVDPKDQGWNTIYDENYINDTHISMWWKQATADDASTAPDEVKMEWTGVNSATAIMYRISGVTFDAGEQFIGWLGNNRDTSAALYVEPIYNTPFDDCLIFKIITNPTGSTQFRMDMAPQGIGKLVESLTPSVSNIDATHIMVKGEPFRGQHGGGTLIPDANQDYDWVNFWVAKNPVEIDLGDAFGFRGVRSGTGGKFQTKIELVLHTPIDTREGDLLICSVGNDFGGTNFDAIPDDPTDGWEQFDKKRSAGFQYTLFWKLASAKDANGAKRYIFRSEAQAVGENTDVEDQVMGMIAAFAGVQEPATDMDFLYQWDGGDLDNTGTDALLGDINFSVAPEGDGLLVCYMMNDSDPITTPSEMVEHLNEDDLILSQVLATEIVSPSTGSVGPKRFINGVSAPWIGSAFILKPFDTGGRGTAGIYDYPKFLDIGNRTRVANISSGGVTMQVPPGTQEDDLLLMCVSREGSFADSGPFSPDSDIEAQGWNLLYESVTSSDVGIGVWWKLADADDASTQPDEILFDWSSIASNLSFVGYIYRIGGVTLDTADSFIELLGSESNNGNIELTDPVVTTPYDNTLIIKVFATGSANSHMGDYQPNGFGKLVDESYLGNNITVTALGAPFAGSYGGGVVRHRTSKDYEIASIGIAKEAV